MDAYLINKKFYFELKSLVHKSIQFGGAEYISVGRIASKLDSDTIYTLEDISLEKAYKDAVFSLFPKAIDVDRSKLKVNKVGLYSMTKPHDAKIMLDIIEKYISLKDSVMINATSGIGGEILNMYSKFKYIYGYELSPTQFKLLKHNVGVYGIKNINLVNDDFNMHLNDHSNKKTQDSCVVIIDPPWGGLDYKKEKILNLTLGEHSMLELAEKIEADLILLKLPANHDLTGFTKFKYDTYNVANYLLVVVDKKIEH
jgi:16S rRNA G966 N2-methylase RsmD